MDKEFDTTFIPKQTLLPPEAQKAAAKNAPKQPLGILGIVAIVAVVAAVASYGVAILGQQSALASIRAAQEQIASARADFDEEFIFEVTELQAKLDQGRKLLDEHSQAQKILQSLEDDTLPNIQFDTMNATFYGDEGKEITIEGMSTSYKGIAQQSLVFNENPYILSHFFADLERNEETDLVGFSLTLVLNTSYRDNAQGAS